MTDKSPAGNQGPDPAAFRKAFAWLFLSFRGRISREVYWLSMGLLLCVLFNVIGLLIGLIGEEATADLILPLGIVSLWFEMALLVKRQQDRGLPWFWCLLAFVPVVGVVWMVAAGVLEGDPAPNAFGSDRDVPPA